MFEITSITPIGFLDRSDIICKICSKKLDDKCPKCEIRYSFPCGVKEDKHKHC